ncbi:hypothetical protein EYF80_017213 [Liparis tanakae]|uniref:Uncharacterized protein n=1 Tax=Liparis tanakae TaxID=230148 RepID=A0A4Z2I3F4_9TELE|nr:hypothetical protein EYF80_017213 [Liparis tanakae]
MFPLPWPSRKAIWEISPSDSTLSHMFTPVILPANAIFGSNPPSEPPSGKTCPSATPGVAATFFPPAQRDARPCSDDHAPHKWIHSDGPPAFTTSRASTSWISYGLRRFPYENSTVLLATVVGFTHMQTVKEETERGTSASTPSKATSRGVTSCSRSPAPPASPGSWDRGFAFNPVPAPGPLKQLVSSLASREA